MKKRRREKKEACHNKFAYILEEAEGSACTVPCPMCACPADMLAGCAETSLIIHLPCMHRYKVILSMMLQMLTNFD